MDGPRARSGRRQHHLPGRELDARLTARHCGARAVDVRDVVRQRDLRGRDRHVLGPEPGAGEALQHLQQASAGRDAHPRPRCHRRGVGVRIRAGRQDRPCDAPAIAIAAGLERPLRAPGGARCGRGGERRGVRQGVPGRRRSGPARRPRNSARQGGRGSPDVERRRRRTRPGGGRYGALRARPRLREGPPRPGEGRPRSPHGDARAAARHRRRADRSGPAPRARGPGRPGRGRRRSGRGAVGYQRPPGDRCGQGAHPRDTDHPAGGRPDRPDL